MKANIRVLARLDVKGSRLIKGVHLEGLRQVGEPTEYASKYYRLGIDEIIFLDIVASLYNRSLQESIVNSTVSDVFVPVTAGGGIREIEDVNRLLRSGADKIAINTAAVKNPKLIADAALKFGSQAVVVSIEAKKINEGRWEVYTDCGRERTGIDALEWAKQVVDLGAGELLVTSIDKEGTRTGFDLELTEKINSKSKVPVIASGGFGNLDHIRPIAETGVTGIAIADGFHFNRIEPMRVKEHLAFLGYEVRL
jgi:cyclase